MLPLRGKILNVASADKDKLVQNQQLSDLVQALGCGTGSHYRDDDLRYDKVVIMTDADVDGAHIASLLITFFYRQMPQLIDKGHLYLAIPPLYRLTQGANTVYARDDAHKDKLLKTAFKGNGKVEIGRFKGLGEMTAAQLKETTMDPKKRTLLRVTVLPGREARDRRRGRAPDGQQARGPLRLHPGARRLRARGSAGYLAPSSPRARSAWWGGPTRPQGRAGGGLLPRTTTRRLARCRWVPAPHLSPHPDPTKPNHPPPRSGFAESALPATRCARGRKEIASADPSTKPLR